MNSNGYQIEESVKVGWRQRRETEMKKTDRYRRETDGEEDSESGTEIEKRNRDQEVSQRYRRDRWRRQTESGMEIGKTNRGGEERQ